MTYEWGEERLIFDVSKIDCEDKIIKIERPKYEVVEEKYEIVEEKKELLNEKEKEYLRAVFKPFRERIEYITKVKSVFKD